MTTLIPHWIRGAEASGTSGRTAPVHNPATGEQTAEVALASTDDVATAVASAKEAAIAWRESSLSRRSAVLFAFRQLLHERTDELAAIITAEHGKVLSDAAGEIARGLENVEFATGVPNLLKGGFSEQASTGVDVYSMRQPLGVVAGITPFNFPAMVPLWMCANAIACGNAFVLKPSEKDPSAANWIAKLWQEAGLPDGVFTVVHGDKEAVDALLTHPDVSAISFVGSTPIAKYIYETGTSHGKRVQALGGAKNHALVLPDADLDMAADALVSAAYGAAGERCMALSVAVAVGDIGDELVAKVAQRLPGLRVGDGAAEGTDMGPLITAEHRDKVRGYIDAGEAAGATLVADGRTGDHPQEGYFLGTTLLDHVTPEMTVYTDEIFGPVLAVTSFDGYDNAMEIANDTRYGLNASVWGKDLRRAARIGAQLEAGNVNVNDGFAASFASKGTPSGGWKASGVGVRHGDAGLLKYTDTTNLATLKQQVYNPRPGQSYEQYAQQTKQVLRWMRKLRIR